MKDGMVEGLLLVCRKPAHGLSQCGLVLLGSLLFGCATPAGLEGIPGARQHIANGALVPLAVGSLASAPVAPLATWIPEEKPNGHLELGRFTYWWLGGIEFSQDRGEFGESNAYMQFTGDTSWRKNSLWPKGGNIVTPDGRDWGDMHTSFDLMLGTVSAITEEPGPGIGDPFLTSKKALSMRLGVDWRPIKLLSKAEGKDHYDILTFGPIAQGGFHTLTEAPGNLERIDTVNSWAALGFRIGAVRQEQGKVNPPLLRHIDFTYGYHENYDDWRLMIDAILRSDPDSGFFLAANAVLGEGEDDVRVMAGISLDLEGLSSAVKGLTQILPGGKKK